MDGVVLVDENRVGVNRELEFVAGDSRVQWF
jgi:hypothetical protein